MSANQANPPPEGDENSAFLRNTAIAGTIVAPIAMLLPPRKVDIRFFVLAGAFSLSTNYLAYSYTGQSIYSRFQSRMLSFAPTGLPPEAERTQRLLREYREKEAAAKQQQQQQRPPLQSSGEDAPSALAKKVEDVWMGGESKDWQKKRAEEHQRQFEEGKGMGSIIIEQIADVWSGNWGASAKKDAGSAADDAPTSSQDSAPPEKRK